MINLINSRNLIHYIIFFFFLNIIFTQEGYELFKISININSNTLGKLYIDFSSTEKNDDSDDDTKCGKWIPSLLSPILLVKNKINVKNFTIYDRENVMIYNPALINDIVTGKCYLSNLYNKYQLVLAKETFGTYVDDCYFGLSSGLGNSSILPNETNLNYLKNTTLITQKIFSFDKWVLKEKSLDIDFYFGDAHQKFSSNNGIIGTCKGNKDDYFFGCPFKKISFNNNIELINDKNGNFYKIFFSSENHNIIFPEGFREKFYKITNNECSELPGTKSISCKNLFNTDNYFPLKLIDENMNITIEIDNILRYNKEKGDDQYETNIKFEEIDYLILPLIVFKQFHVQFNANDNLISFYTTNETILEIKKEEENSKKEDEPEESSNAGTIILIIFISLIILALVFGIFWFIRKRKSSGEKNINKYNKFEEDDNFQDMNEKRLF